MTLFHKQDFVGASGIPLTWKIECDALTDDDWDCIAYVGSQMLSPFVIAVGVPTGGERLAKAMNKYATPTSLSPLVVDDVWTTGKSFNEFKRAFEKTYCLFSKQNILGFVAFARGPLTKNVKCFMKTNSLISIINKT